MAHRRITRTVHGTRQLRYRFSCGEHNVNKTMTISGPTLNVMRRGAESNIDAMLLLLKKDLGCGDPIVNEEIIEVKA